MASSVTYQTTPAGGITEILAQMVTAGWTHEATANPFTSSSTNYYVMKSPSGSNSIGANYWVMIYNPNATNYIVIQLFEGFVGGGTPTKQYWAPSTGGTVEASFRWNASAQNIDVHTGSIGTGALDCGTTGYTLVTKATIDYVCCASQNQANPIIRRNFYAGSYSVFSWNTETMPLILTASFNRQTQTTSPPQSYAPDANGSYTSVNFGSSLTRERYNGAWQAGGGATQNNFTGGWVPLKSIMTSNSSLPPGNSRDVFSTTNIVGVPSYIVKFSGNSSSPFREAWLGTYRDIQDFGGVGGGNVGDTIVVSSSNYYLIGNTTSVAGDIYILS